MQNEQLERYLLDLLVRLSSEDAGEVLEAVLSSSVTGRFFVSDSESVQAASLGRRILREEEKLALEDGTEGLLIELQEMGVLTPPVMERLLERIHEFEGGTVSLQEAVELASLILRTENPDMRRRNSLVLEGMGDEMTLH